MNILISYCYSPNTTAVYFERAFRKNHQVFDLVSPYLTYRGYDGTPDLIKLIQAGLPRPDFAIWIDSGGGFFPKGWENLECPSACYLIDVHTNLGLRKNLARFFDYIFIAQKDYLHHFYKLGDSPVLWLPLACDPEIHNKSQENRMWDIGFVGNINSSVRQHRLELLSSKFKINPYQRWYSKEEIGLIYGESKIIFNCSLNGDLNMRVFEAMSSGALLVTDKIGNGQSELFENGVHLVEYESDEELVELIDYYLLHEDERLRIAQTGQNLVLNKHTYDQRVKSILDYVFVQGKIILSSDLRNSSKLLARRTYISYFQKQYMIEAIMDEFKDSVLDRQGIVYALFQSFLAYLRRISMILRSTIKNK